MYEHVFEEGKERMHTLEAMTTRNVADALAKCPLLYAPGQGWQYGSSADVLGAIIEAASGIRRFGYRRKSRTGWRQYTRLKLTKMVKTY